MPEHLIEPELQQKTPRKVHKRGTQGNGTRLAQWLMIPFLLLAVLAPLWALHSVYVQLAGPLVPVEIIDRYKVNDDDDALYYVVYRAPQPAKDAFPREMVAAESFNKVVVGSKLPLQVSPLFPGYDSLLRIPGQELSGRLFGFLFFAVLMVGMGTVLAWSIYIVPAKARYLVVRGVPVIGHIVDKSKRSTADDEVTGYYMHYEYQPTETNTPVQQGKQQVNFATWHEAESNGEVTVLYDSKKPASSLIYRFSDYEAIP